MRLINRSRLKYKSLAIGGGFFTQQHQQSLRGCLPRRPEQGASPLHSFQTLAAEQRGTGPFPFHESVCGRSRVKVKPLRGRPDGANLDTSKRRNSGGMGACPHLRGRGRSSHEEAAAARDGRGSPSHQHTVTGRQLYFLLLSAGGRESVTSKPFSRRGGGCRPPRLIYRYIRGGDRPA